MAPSDMPGNLCEVFTPSSFGLTMLTDVSMGKSGKQELLTSFALKVGHSFGNGVVALNVAVIGVEGEDNSSSAEGDTSQSTGNIGPFFGSDGSFFGKNSLSVIQRAGNESFDTAGVEEDDEDTSFG